MSPAPVPAILLTLLLPAMEAAGASARPNLARNKPCKASSVEGNLTPDKAVDGPKSQASRWGSNYGSDRNKDSAWIRVDLGAIHRVDSVAIYWEHSGARRFGVQAWKGASAEPSDGDEGWETLLEDTTLVYTPPPVDMCLSFLKIPPTEMRHLRIRCYQRIFEFGFSIMELEVYGREPDPIATRRPKASGPAFPDDPIVPETGGRRRADGQSFRWNGAAYGADGRGRD